MYIIIFDVAAVASAAIELALYRKRNHLPLSSSTVFIVSADMCAVCLSCLLPLRLPNRIRWKNWTRNGKHETNVCMLLAFFPLCRSGGYFRLFLVFVVEIIWFGISFICTRINCFTLFKSFFRLPFPFSTWISQAIVSSRDAKNRWQKKGISFVNERG